MDRRTFLAAVASTAVAPQVGAVEPCVKSRLLFRPTWCFYLLNKSRVKPDCDLIAEFRKPDHSSPSIGGAELKS